MLEAMQLMRAMFPGRIPFVEIHRRFVGKLPASVMRMSPGDFIRAVVAALEIPESDFQYGTSRLFFRTGGADFLRDLQYADAAPRFPPSSLPTVLSSPPSSLPTVLSSTPSSLHTTAHSHPPPVALTGTPTRTSSSLSSSPR
jgi:hypothetical protein